MVRAALLLTVALLACAASAYAAARPRAPDTDRIIVALRQRNVELLEQKLWDVSDPASPRYRKFLSFAELTKLTGASDEAVARVSAWLVSLGATRITLQAGRDFIRAEFSRQIPDAVLTVPAHLAEHATMVMPYGRPSGPKQRRPVGVNRPHTPMASAPVMTPSVQKALYQVPAGLMGTNTTNSQMVWGTGTYGINLSDCKTFYAKYGVNENISLVQPMGFPGNPRGDNFGEGTLDAQYITSLGPGIKTFVYNSNNSASTEYGLGFGPAFTDFIVALANMSQPPLVLSLSLGSLSWSSCNVLCTEAMAINKTLTYDQCLDYAASNFQVCMYDGTIEMSLVNTEFIKLGLRGVSIVAATGDGGTHFSFGPFPNNDPLGALLNKISCRNTMPTFPASSGYLTAIGGLLLPASGAEPVVCDASLGCMVTGGGAFSWYFPMPSYQAAQVQTYLALPQNKNLSFAFNASNRAYPDVVTNANNAPIVINGAVQLTGGTSAATPEFGGMISLINDALLNAGQAPLGFLNPALYALGNQQPAAFYDITKGSTRCGSSTCPCPDGFAASPGWDAASGLGMPIFPALLEHLGPKQLLRKALAARQ